MNHDALRRRRGIVHTPPELARFTATAIDDLLRRKLGVSFGLADPQIRVLDPACGPGAFLAATLEVADGPGPRSLLGVDIDEAAIQSAEALLRPRAVARGLRLELVCEDALASVRPFGTETMGETVVILGNPPWAGRSEHRGDPRSDHLLEDFRRDAEGHRLSERRLGVLSDAYVRFFRWALEVGATTAGGVVVALVTNSSFLDGPVHRGMRSYLLRFFDGIDVLDLGGSALVARGRERDENLFGVRPGAALTIGYRSRATHERSDSADVRFAALRGRRAEKLAILGQEPIETLPFRSLDVRAPHFVFRPSPRSDRTLETFALCDAIPFSREGVQTNRDDFVIAKTREELFERLLRFADGEAFPSLERKPHFDPVLARARLREVLASGSGNDRDSLVRPIAYRPFDDRFFVPLVPLCHRPRPELGVAMALSKFAIVTVRKDRGDVPWAHFGAVRWTPDNCWLSARSSCRTRAFPVFMPDGRPNLADEVRRRFEEAVGSEVDVESFFLFVLATLASSSYREAFGASAKLDYPRVPMPRDHASFLSLVGAGRLLRNAFLSEPAGERSTTVVGHRRLEVSTETVDALDAADAAYRRAFGEDSKGSGPLSVTR